jgi:hypothetical protein
MSHRTGRRSSQSSSSKATQYPSAWSEWSWTEKHQCNVRYREKGPGKSLIRLTRYPGLYPLTCKFEGDYEYEYNADRQQPIPKESSNPLDSIQETTQYPSSNAYNTAPENIIDSFVGALNETSLYANPQSRPVPAQGITNHIRTRNPKTTTEKFDPSRCRT